MSQPTDSSVGELELIVTALVGLARDRGATTAQRETLGGIWAELQAATLAQATSPELHRRATSLASELLGIDALLAPANAPYGGFWQEAEAASEHSTVAAPPTTGEIQRDEVQGFVADGAPSWAELAARGLTGSLAFRDACEVIEELARVVAPGPYLQTVAVLPALPAEERERVASGESSWALATGPLVLDLDTATSVAIVAGDGIFELVGAERELLATRDQTRPLGVVVGGDAGRRLGDSTSLPLIRRRLLVGLAFEALGVIGAIDSGAGHAARTLADHAARLVDADHPDAESLAVAAKAVAADLASDVSAAALAAAPNGAPPRLGALQERARFVRVWEAAPAQLRTELGETLLAGAAE